MTAKSYRKIIISRTDAIGDVVLTLPLAAILKKHFGESTKITFWGRSYTRPVIECCNAVDAFLDYDEFIKMNASEKVNFLEQNGADAIIHVFPRKEIADASYKAGIPLRVGTTNRLYHWWTCNKLVRLSRKNSVLHEAQLNARLLSGLGLKINPGLDELGTLYRLNKIQTLPENIATLLSRDRFKLVIHPKSHSSAREWSLENFRSLFNRLDKNKFQVILTGGEGEKKLLDEWAQSLQDDILNLTGKLTLAELISLLNSVDGILAASTGPLHLAAAMGKYTLGIYPPIRPMDPGRWGPLGNKAGYIVVDKKCSACRSVPLSCHCMNEVSPIAVESRIYEWLK